MAMRLWTLEIIHIKLKQIIKTWFSSHLGKCNLKYVYIDNDMANVRIMPPSRDIESHRCVK